MTNPTFHAAIRPELHPAAQALVAIYEAVPGALTYPGCMPEGLAAVLEHMAAKNPLIDNRSLIHKAALLRGEQP
jgi:hypothetical protein